MGSDLIAYSLIRDIERSLIDNTLFSNTKYQFLRQNFKIDYLMKNFNQKKTCDCEELSIEQLEMTLSYLMSRFAVQPREQVAHAVLHHLEILIEHVDPGITSTKRKHYAKLFNYWWLNIYKNSNSEQTTQRLQLAEPTIVHH